MAVLNDRDKLILKYLARFRVLTRLQIEELVFSDLSTKSRTPTTNRVMLRLTRDRHVTQIQRPKAEPYWYMPNPPLKAVESSKNHHFLALVDLYIAVRPLLGAQDVFVVEPKVNTEYQPDAYAWLPEPVVIEYQRTSISNAEMQSKVDRFHRSLLRGDHDASTLWIASEAKQYKVEIPEGIVVTQFHPRLIADWARIDKAYKI